MSDFSKLSSALKNKQAPLETNEQDSQQSPSLEPLSAKRGRGRPRGKRSDPNWEQIGLFLPVVLHRQVKKILIDRPDTDLSELVAELLQVWVDDQEL